MVAQSPCAGEAERRPGLGFAGRRCGVGMGFLGGAAGWLRGRARRGLRRGAAG